MRFYFEFALVAIMAIAAVVFFLCSMCESDIDTHRYGFICGMLCGIASLQMLARIDGGSKQ